MRKYLSTDRGIVLSIYRFLADICFLFLFFFNFRVQPLVCLVCGMVTLVMTFHRLLGTRLIRIQTTNRFTSTSDRHVSLTQN